MWHFYRNLEFNKNKKCYKDVNENKDIFILYKCITKLPFIDPVYLEDLFLLIKTKTNNERFLEFLKYFYKTYILKYPINDWNYFNKIEDTTNNCCESYNNYLNGYFNKKPSFFKLLFILREEENFILKEEAKLLTGLWSPKFKKLGGRTDEIDIYVSYYKDKINEMKLQNDTKNDIIQEWYKCLNKISFR